jgi:hypothetical protein
MVFFFFRDGFEYGIRVKKRGGRKQSRGEDVSLVDFVCGKVSLTA